MGRGARRMLVRVQADPRHATDSGAVHEYPFLAKACESVPIACYHCAMRTFPPMTSPRSMAMRHSGAASTRATWCKAFWE